MTENVHEGDDTTDLQSVNCRARLPKNVRQIGQADLQRRIYIEDYVMTFAGLTQKDGSFLVSREKYDNFTLEDLRGKYIIGGREGVCYK